MKKSICIIGGLCVVLLAVSYSLGAELGRISIKEGVAEGDITVERDYAKIIRASRTGLELNLDWSRSKWKIGDEDFEGDAWGPEIGLFYGINEYIDCRISGAYWKSDDKGSDLKVGRIGIGSKIWIPTGTRFAPSLGVLLGYYIIDADWDGHKVDTDDRFGISLRGGIDYIITEFWSLGLGFKYDTLFGSSNVKIDGRDDDFKFSSLGFIVSTSIFF